jgi:hypothetical protein
LIYYIPVVHGLMPLLAIYNPVCGDGTAGAFFQEIVLPFLEKHGKSVDKVVATKSAGHAGTILVDFLESVDGDVTVVLGSGDGTLHEIINTLSQAPLKGVRAGAPPSRLHFVLVPCGTANALYSSFFPPSDADHTQSYRLKSVQSFIDGVQIKPLTLGITSLSSPPFERKRPHALVSAVVTSTSLHASILHASESLRSAMPGIERFKVAAQMNAARWYKSFVKLLPAPGAKFVQIYDHHTNGFVQHDDSHEDDPIVDLDGPFSYFLSTVNVDRLEPAFMITPLASRIRPTEATLDIVIVRPLRDPSIHMDTPDGRNAFAPKLSVILGAAYREGSHVDLRYNSEGDVVDGGVGPVVVEYFRCGGWEWIPVSSIIIYYDEPIPTSQSGRFR